MITFSIFIFFCMQYKKLRGKGSCLVFGKDYLVILAPGNSLDTP